MKVKHRSNTDNRMHHIFDPENDYHIRPEFLYAGTVRPKKKWREVAHLHDFNEILFILEGEGTIYIEDEIYSVKAGDLIIYNAGLKHYEVSSENNPLKFNFVAFDINTKKLLLNNEPLVYETGFLNDAFITYFETLLNEVATKKSYYKEVVNSLLRLIIASVFRLVNEQLGLKNGLNKTSKIVSEAKSYIDKYFIDDLSIDKIASAIYISNYYLIHLFKKETGITINEYIHKKRIDHSKETLLNSDFTISEVALSSGYNSLNYFCRRFKKATGQTPSEYRISKE